MTAAPGLRRSLAWSGLGSLVSLVFLFGETALVARLLPTEEYGVYVVLLTVVNALLMLVDLGLKTSATQLIASRGEEGADAVVSTALVFRMAVVAATAVPIAVGWLVISRVDSAQPLLVYLPYVPAMLAVASLDELVQAMLQGFHRYRQMTAAQTLRVAARLLVTLVLLVRFELGPMALVYGWVATFALSSAYGYAALPIGRGWRVDRSLLRQMLRFGAPLQGTRLLSFASGRAHVLLLGALAGPSAVAYYAIGARIPEALQQLLDAYSRVYFPTVAARFGRGQRPDGVRLLNRTLGLLPLSSGLVALVGALFAPEIVRLVFSARYEASASVLALLLLAWHTATILNVLGYTLTAVGRPGRSLLVDVVRAGVNCLGALPLVPALGAVGSGLAAAVAGGASLPVAAVALRRDVPELDLATCARVTGALIAAVGLDWWLAPTGLAPRAGLIGLFALVAGWSSWRHLAPLLPSTVSQPARIGPVTSPP